MNIVHPVLIAAIVFGGYSEKRVARGVKRVQPPGMARMTRF